MQQAKQVRLKNWGSFLGTFLAEGEGKYVVQIQPGALAVFGLAPDRQEPHPILLGEDADCIAADIVNHKVHCLLATGKVMVFGESAGVYNELFSFTPQLTYPTLPAGTETLRCIRAIHGKDLYLLGTSMGQIILCDAQGTRKGAMTAYNDSIDVLTRITYEQFVWRHTGEQLNPRYGSVSLKEMKE
jgi:hypothetical protein